MLRVLSASRTRYALCALVGVTIHACVTYRPAPAVTPEMRRVRVTFAPPRDLLGTSGASEADSLTLRGVRQLKGWVTAVRGDTLVVRAERLDVASGGETLQPPYTVRVPRDATVQVQTSQISAGRTALLVGGLAVGVLIVVVVIPTIRALNAIVHAGA